MDQQPPPDLPTEPLPLPPGAPVSPGLGYDPSAPPPPEPQAPPRRRGRVLVAGIVVFALLLAGGAAAAFIKMRGSGEQLLSKIPASSDVVFTAYLDPSAGQKANLFMLASKFPALGSEQQLTATFEQVLDQALTSTGLNHGDLSWVGDQVALVVNVPATIGAGASPAFALLVKTKDEGAAKATLQKLQDPSRGSSNGPWTTSTIDGVQVSSNHAEADAVFDGTVVGASSLDEMSAIISTAHGHQAALEGSSSLQAATAGLPEGKLALLYVNPTDIISLLKQVPGLSTMPTTSPDLSTFEAVTGFAMTVSAQPDGVALDAQAVFDPSKLSDEQKAQMNAPGHPNPLLSSIPGDALAVISGEQLDTTLKMLADQMAATSPQAAKMLTKLGISGDAGLVATLSGDDAIEVAPQGAGSAPGGAIILGTKDPAAMQRALDQLARGLTSLSQESSSSVSSAGGGISVTRSSSGWVRNDYHGVTISTFQGTGIPDISYAIVDNQGVIGSSLAQVQRVVDTAKGGANISSSAAYRDALASVPSSAGSVWVDIQGIAALIRGALPADQRTAFDVLTMPNLAPLKALVVGAESDESHEHVRVFLKIG